MKTLAIDTSLAAGSVAALEGDRSATRPLGAPNEHARLLPATLVEVAAALGWTPRDVELVAVVRGPGSFTGLRVGVATAKALAWTTGARLVAVSGFELVARVAHAAAGWPEAPIHVAYDAGRGEVCAATVTPSTTAASGWSAGPGTLVPLADWLDSLAVGALVAGPAVDAAAAALTSARPDLRLAPAAGRGPTAAAAAAVALLRFAAGQCDDAATLLPDYMRPSYAEERRPSVE